MRVRTESEEKFKQYLNHPRRERAVPLLNQEGSPSALAACGAENPPVSKAVTSAWEEWCQEPFSRGMVKGNGVRNHFQAPDDAKTISIVLVALDLKPAWPRCCGYCP
jgi:hypothetical protein